MSDLPLDRSLPVGGVGRISAGWWGLICVIATEGALFAYFLFAYFYLAVQPAGNWTPRPPPLLRFTLPGVIVLLVSGVAAWWALRGAARGSRLDQIIGLAAAAVLGIGFLVLQLLDWEAEAFSMQSSEFGSIFYTLTAAHLAHLAFGVLALLLIMVWSALGYFDVRRHVPVLIGVTYWYFVVVIGVIVFLALYVAPSVW